MSFFRLPASCFALPLLWLVACGGSGTSSQDLGSPDQAGVVSTDLAAGDLSRTDAAGSSDGAATDGAATDGAITDGGATDGSATDGGLTLAERSSAATTTAKSNALCTAIAPFYWEIGDKSAALVSGQVGTAPPDHDTVLALASASKWIFGGYVIEKRGGTPLSTDIPLLNFTSGYMNFTSDICTATTVDGCLASNGSTQTQAEIGRFYYNGEHLEELAHDMGLGADTAADLTTEVLSQLGTELGLYYYMPQPAGGLKASSDQYALFLRKLLVGSTTPLKMATVLGDGSVCTNPATCSTADYSPIPGIKGSTESWSYGYAHWIENDPTVGDGSFSSPGAFGFYPWVNKTRTLYGVLSRQGSDEHAGYNSAECGRLIRKAYVTGMAQ